MVKRQQFTAEFKREAVRQMRAGDKPIAQLSRELGIPRNRLYKWNQAVEAHGEAEAFPGSGRRCGNPLPSAPVRETCGRSCLSEAAVARQCHYRSRFGSTGSRVTAPSSSFRIMYIM